jgi:REP element-mobilizing transposase RayT
MQQFCRAQFLCIMSTYTQILYQVVFSTKYRRKTLAKPGREQLFRYIWGILDSRRCKLFRINCVEDHMHIVFSLHQSVALAQLVQDIKVGSSLYIKRNKLFPEFTAWQTGYGAFTYSAEARRNLIRYVMNQEAHHARKNFKKEYVQLLREQEVEFEEGRLFEEE